MKLERRVVFSRLIHISLKHAEFESTYIGARREIEVSRIQANRFLRGMNRHQLLKVHLAQEWNEQAREEEEIRKKEQADRAEEERTLQIAQNADKAAEKVALVEAVRKAKETLGLPARELGEGVVIEDEQTEDVVEGHVEPTAPASASKKKKKNRAQLALEFEKSRLQKEEADLKAQADAAKAAEAERLAQAAVPLDPFSPEEAQVYVDYIRKFAFEYHDVRPMTSEQIEYSWTSGEND
jgi:hypothetical protein